MRVRRRAETPLTVRALRALVATCAGAVSGWGVWLYAGLVLDATVGTQCHIYCVGGGEPSSSPPECFGNPQACALSTDHLAVVAGSALLGILVTCAMLWYLRRPGRAAV